MSEIQSSPSIQETNAALLAQHKAAMAASEAKRGGIRTGGTSFASTMQAIESQPLPAPTKIAASNQAIAAPKAQAQVQSQAKVVQEEDCSSPTISRSARMACADKATEVVTSEDDFGVGDIIDLINPLHHIPVLGTIYREVTGDTIKPEVQVAGSIAFGAITGSIFVSAISGVVSAAIEAQTGKEPTVMVADALFGSDTVKTDGAPTTEKVVVAQSSGMFDGLFAASPSVPVERVALEDQPQQKVAAVGPEAKPATQTDVLMQAHAKAQAGSQPLPSELVQDMMMLALDKYQTAHMMSLPGDQSSWVQ